MAKVYGLHEIELLPGVDPGEFERLAAEMTKALTYEGWTYHLVKGERGERAGKYMIVMEIESLEARDRYAPTADGPFSVEVQEWERRNAAILLKWKSMATMPGENTVFTDYVVVL